jgi:hypothetical protein
LKSRDLFNRQGRLYTPLQVLVMTYINERHSKNCDLQIA